MNADDADDVDDAHITDDAGVDNANNNKLVHMPLNMAALLNASTTRILSPEFGSERLRPDDFG